MKESTAIVICGIICVTLVWLAVLADRHLRDLRPNSLHSKKVDDRLDALESKVTMLNNARGHK